MDLPPVKREMAALTSVGDSQPLVSSQDTLVCQTYNAATRAARSVNVLTILLAAIRKTTSPEDHDNMTLLDTTLIDNAQFTRDIGAAMSSSMLGVKQINPV